MPKTGQTVQYFEPILTKDSQEPIAAIITGVHTETVVDLMIFLPGGNAAARSRVQHGAADDKWWKPLEECPENN